MRILQINASYKPAYIYGGPTMSVAKLSEELQKHILNFQNDGEESDIKIKDISTAVSGLQKSSAKNNKVVVYSTLANGKEELPYRNGEIKFVDGIEVHYFKRLTKDHSHFSPALLWHTWKNIKYFDVIQIHAWWNLVSVGVAIIAFLKQKKLLITPRGTLSAYSFSNHKVGPKKIFQKLIGNHLFRNSYFHFTSKMEQNEVLKHISPKKSFVIPNFVDLPSNPNNGRQKLLATQKLNLIFLSRIEQKKGLELLFETLKEVTEFECSLQIVGTGEIAYIQSLQDTLTQLKLQHQVSWLGLVQGDEKFKLLSNADYLVLPSFNENFANVVIESLYCGTPVIISDKVGLWDYVKDSNLGIIHERSVQALKVALIKAYNMKKDSLFIPDCLHEQIIRDFKGENLLNEYLKMYGCILETKS